MLTRESNPGWTIAHAQIEMSDQCIWLNSLIAIMRGPQGPCKNNVIWTLRNRSQGSTAKDMSGDAARYSYY
jgi:hypothetical protein